MNMRTNSQNLC